MTPGYCILGNILISLGKFPSFKKQTKLLIFSGSAVFSKHSMSRKVGEVFLFSASP